MAQQNRRFYEFGGFRLDAANRLLLREGRVVPLKPKVVETLLVLVERRGEVLGKDALMELLWPEQFVEESNLTQNIYVLRKTLGETPGAPEFIETIPRRGYRFIAAVTEGTADGDGATSTSAAASVGVPPPETDTEAAAAEVVDESRAVESVADEPTTPGVASEASVLTTPPSSSTVGRPQTRRRTGALVVAALLLVGVCVGAVFWVLIGGRSAGGASVRSVAVLPFKPLGAEAEEAYLGPGMADALITKLSGNGRVAVTPTSAVLRYGAAGQDPRAAGRELGVDAVLDGKVQRAGEQVRVTVQLVRVGDGATLWAEKFDGEFSNIFRIQDAISEQTARALTLRLSGDERARTRKHYTENAEAYQAYLKGRYFWNKRTPEGFRKGVEYFRRAIEVDPAYALAYAGLADCYVRLGDRGGEEERGAVARGTEAVTKALELDDSLAEAHAAAGFIRFRFEWDFAGAEREYRRALELDPDYSEAHQWYAFQLLARGRRAEADREIARALELDPASLGNNAARELYLYFSRRYEESLAQCRKTLEMEPEFAPTHYVLALDYEQLGRYEEAEAELRHASTPAALSHVLAAAGKKDEARAALAQLQEYVGRGEGVPADVALAYLGLGERERALDWYERAADARSLRPAWLLLDPRLDPLRDSPRFAALLKRLGASG
jgi:DNA-binding winged helix-turn-helix (wHTH) protein/TolB-like protein/Flp pilus assembly protein TadD